MTCECGHDEHDEVGCQWVGCPCVQKGNSMTNTPTTMEDRLIKTPVTYDITSGLHDAAGRLIADTRSVRVIDSEADAIGEYIAECINNHELFKSAIEAIEVWKVDDLPTVVELKAEIETLKASQHGDLAIYLAYESGKREAVEELILKLSQQMEPSEKYHGGNVIKELRLIAAEMIGKPTE